MAQCAYPPPRGQGSLPRPPGYLYVRPRRRQCSAEANHRRALVTVANPKTRENAAVASLRATKLRIQRRRFASGNASVLRRCAQRSVCGRAASGRTGPACPRRAGGARGQEWRSCQRRYKLGCGRGLTGRSTGGATAGRLARTALFVYPAPRGQGNLPRPPGYLYVRPHSSYCSHFPIRKVGCYR